MVELLAPAGSKENFITAVNCGANAVYLGLDDFSARKNAENFTLENLPYYLAYAKTFDVKVYVAVNTIIRNDELDKFFNVILSAYNLGVDAFILQDVFLGEIIKTKIPNIELHLSTQAGVCNVYGAMLAKEYGFSRVILSRETEMKDIEEIAKIIDVEVFIHGALCSSFSGHCYFSSFVGGNSGNRGLCKQPCRKKYSYYENGVKIADGYSLSLSDLKADRQIDKLISLGVKSFKIEGRMRSSEYCGASVMAYRAVLDGKNPDAYFDDLLKIYNRGDYTEGYYSDVFKNIISNKIQNHKGKHVANVSKIYNGYLTLNKPLKMASGDSFKIIRNGLEVGNATYKNEKLLYSGDVKLNDDVNITKSVALVEKYNSISRKIAVDVSVKIEVGKQIELSAFGVTVKSENVVEVATNSKISESEVLENLNKTDVYPFNIKANVEINGDCFVPKSVFNRLRARLYNEIFHRNVCKNNVKIDSFYNYSKSEEREACSKTVVVTDELNCDFSGVIVYLPSNYNNIDVSINNTKNSEIYLYLPPFLSGRDLSVIEKNLTKFDGIYCDGYYGIKLAEKYGLKLFAGFGFNLFNDIDISKISKITNYFAYSKELSNAQILNLNNKNGFVFTAGGINLMDFIYCPFGKDCKNCKRGNKYMLIDEDGREFPVIRYKISTCRFKVFNNAVLFNSNVNRKIYSLVGMNDRDKTALIEGIKSGELRSDTFDNKTVGNSKGGVK